MTRFWTRFINSFQKDEKKKKKLPVIVFDEYATPPCYLTESPLYKYYLVRVEKLEYAYNMLLINQHKKSYWKMMAPLLQIWYSELEKVNQQSQHAFTVLQTRLDDLSQTLENISSPLKNRDRHSLKKAQQFIATRLKEWESTSNYTTSNASSALSNESPTSCNKTASLAMASSPSHQHTLFLEAAWQHKTAADLRDSQCQGFYEDIEKRIEQEIGSSNKTSNMRLTQCIRQVYRLQQDFYLHHRYITSQFSILWDLGSICLSSLKDNEQEPKLYEAIKMKWQQQYHHQMKSYGDLEAKFKELLKSNTVHREDFTCAICLSILNEPVTLTNCYHTFCRSCIQHMYCAHCYRHRAKTISRISENLGSLLSKSSPIVDCTCHVIDRISGEPTLIRDQNKATCPLCRVAFKPNQCTADLALEKFISLYFPKNKQDGDDEEGDEKMDRKKKGSNSVSRKNARGEEKAGVEISRRRSQINAVKFYSKMQRWSNRQRNMTADTSNSNQRTPPVPPLRTSQQIRNDVFAVAGQYWMY